MEETNRRKLHPAIEILLIAVLIFGFDLIKGSISTLFLIRANPNNIASIMPAYNLVFLITSYISAIIAALICTKVIEKRAIHFWGVCLIGLCVGIVTSFIGSTISRFVTMFTGVQLAVYTYVVSFVFPILKAVLITVFVNLFDKNQDASTSGDSIMYCSLPVHILLLLFTFGIWQLVWIYRVTAYLNCVRDEEYRNPTAKLLLCMFIPFYYIYWTYKSAQRIDELASSAGISSGLAVACLILVIFIPIIPPILMQDRINKIATTK